MLYIQKMSILKWLFSFLDKSIYKDKSEEIVEEDSYIRKENSSPYNIEIKEVKIKIPKIGEPSIHWIEIDINKIINTRLP